jgi:hypothetical protein
MFEISEGLVKSTKKPGVGVGTVRVPTDVTQIVQDKAGAALQKAGQIKEGAAGLVQKVPQVPAGTGVAMGVSGALRVGQQPADQGQYTQTNITQDNQYGREQGYDDEGFNQGENIIAPQSHPIFGTASKQEVLTDAFKKGANSKQLDELEAIYDRFGVQGTGVVSEEVQKAASSLRTEYIGQSKQNGYMDIVNSYRKVVGASPNPAGDLSLVFAYMKMLDPGSTVREGEYASAEQTTGVPGRIVSMYNKLLKGDKLNDTQRKEFKEEAKRIFEDSSKVQKQIDKIYTDLAQRYGVDPSLVGIGAINIE